MSCRTCHSLDCDDGPTLGTYSLQRVILPEVSSAGAGSLSLAALGVSNGCLGVAFSKNIIATGRSSNSRTTWSILSGALPDGLTLTPHGTYATISGTPTETGTNSFIVLATGSDGTQATRQYSLPIYLTCTAGDYGDLYGIESISYSPNQRRFLITGSTQPGVSKIYVYDPVNDIMVDSIIVGGGSADIDSPLVYSPTENRFYIYDPAAVLVYVLSATGDVINTIDVSASLGAGTPSNEGPRDVAVGTDRFYVGSVSSASTPNDRTISSVLLSTQAIDATLDLAALSYTSGDMQLCYSPSDEKLYAGVRDFGAPPTPEKLVRIHKDTLAFEAELELFPTLHQCAPIAYCPVNKCLYVTYQDPIIKVVDVDPASGTYFTVVATIDLSDGFTNCCPDVVYAEGPEKMVISVHDSSGTTYIHTIDPATNLVTETQTITPDCGGFHLGWDPDQDKVFLTNNVPTPPQIFGRSIT